MLDPGHHVGIRQVHTRLHEEEGIGKDDDPFALERIPRTGYRVRRAQRRRLHGEGRLRIMPVADVREGIAHVLSKIRAQDEDAFRNGAGQDSREGVNDALHHALATYRQEGLGRYMGMGANAGSTTRHGNDQLHDALRVAATGMVRCAGGVRVKDRSKRAEPRH